MRNRSWPQRARTKETTYGRATIALCVVFGIVFLFEAYVGGGSLWDIKPQVLAALGGNTPGDTLVRGEWWRLVTATLMHGGILHVAFNTYAMLIIGSALEKTIGPGWMLGPFAVSGITGSIVSASFNPPNVVSVGASGGVFGLVAMAALLSYLAPRIVAFSREVLVQWLIFALVIGFAAGFDNAGHIGGIIGGALCALPVIALRTKPETVRTVGWAFGAVGLIVLVAGAGLGIRNIVTQW